MPPGMVVTVPGGCLCVLIMEIGGILVRLLHS